MKRYALHFLFALEGLLGILYISPIWSVPLLRMQEVAQRGVWGTAFLLLFATEAVLCLAAGVLGCAKCCNRVYALLSFGGRALCLLSVPIFILFSYTSVCALLGKV